MSDLTKLPETIEEACQYHGLTLEEITPYAQPKNDRQHAVNCVEHAFVAASAINENWVHDYDSMEYKHEIWADMRGQAAGGSGFSLNFVFYHFSFSIVGARLVFKDEETAEYAAVTFPEIYKAFQGPIKA